MEATQVLPDEQIIDLYWDRDETAISQTDLKYRNYLYTIAYQILSSHEDSEECLNDTYLKTWNSIPPAKPNLLRAFLSRITRNTALDQQEAAARQKRVPEELCDPLSDFEGFLSDTPGMEELMEANRIGRMICEDLDTVSDRKLYMFISRYYFFVPAAKIAQKLHISESAVRKQLLGMKQALRQRLIEGGAEL